MRRHSDTDNSIITVNGECISLISASNRGYLYGDGVFETMLFYKGRIPLLSLHLQRLEDACSRLSIALDLGEIEENIFTMQSTMNNRGWEFAKVRLTLTRSEGGRASYVTPEASAVISIHASFMENVSFSDLPVDLKMAEHALPSFPALVGIKHINRLPYIMGAKGIALGAQQEIVFCDEHENVIETMHHNIFFIESSSKDNSSKVNTIVTPILKTCGVSGISRRLVQESLCEDIGLDFRESDLPLTSISDYSNCFIGNAIRGFTSVLTLGEVSFEKTALVDRLNQSFKQRLETSCEN